MKNTNMLITNILRNFYLTFHNYIIFVYPNYVFMNMEVI